VTVKSRLPCLLVLASFAIIVAGTILGAAQPLIPAITGPPALAPGQVAAYNLTVAGEPGNAEVNYTITYWITGSNVTGGAPLSSSPGHASGNQTTYTLNVTAPPTEQTMTLHVQINAQVVGGTAENATADFAVLVISPIILSATFHNASPTAAVNVTVRFYVDNVRVGTSQIARINPNVDATVSSNYLPVGLQPGQHTVRVEADLDNNGIIDASKGEVVATDLFYRETPGLGPGWTFLIGLVAFVPVFLGVVALRRRGQT
jgi:hypothetical protein